MKELLLRALERMDKASSIIEVMKLSYLYNIGQSLDTSDIRKELEQLEENTIGSKLTAEKLSTISEQLKSHLDSITDEQFDKEWAEIKSMGIESPTVTEYLQASHRKSINEVYQEAGVILPENMQVPKALTNSQITAMCIQAGITDEEEIKWIQHSHPAYTGTIEELIQYVLNQERYKNK